MFCIWIRMRTRCFSCFFAYKHLFIHLLRSLNLFIDKNLHLLVFEPSISSLSCQFFCLACCVAISFSLSLSLSLKNCFRSGWTMTACHQGYNRMIKFNNWKDLLTFAISRWIFLEHPFSSCQLNSYLLKSPVCGGVSLALFLSIIACGLSNISSFDFNDIISQTIFIKHLQFVIIDKD